MTLEVSTVESVDSVTYKHDGEKHARLPGVEALRRVSKSGKEISLGYGKGGIVPNIVALVFYQQEEDTTGRRQKQICQHSFNIHADGETGVESPKIPTTALNIISKSRVSMSTGVYMTRTGELTGGGEPR